MKEAQWVTVGQRAAELEAVKFGGGKKSAPQHSTDYHILLRFESQTMDHPLSLTNLLNFNISSILESKVWNRITNQLL